MTRYRDISKSRAAGSVPKKPADWLKYLNEQKEAGLIRGYYAQEMPVTPDKKRKHKYGAIRTQVEGIWFDSAKEAGWYVKLLQMEQAGLIKDLRLQVPYVLIEPKADERGCKYVADFCYIENGLQVVADVKSSATRKTRGYVIKRKLMLSVHNIKIKEL